MIKVQFTKEAWDKIQFFVNKSPVEVSGMGMVTKEKGIWTVTSAFMMPQKNGPASTDIEPEEVNKMLYETRDQPGSMIFWWHSHVNMSVFWSGTDWDTINKLSAEGQVLASVFNKKGEHRTAMRVKADFGDETLASHVVYDEMEVSVLAPANPSLNAWELEYASNIIQSTTYPQYGGGWIRDERGRYMSQGTMGFGSHSESKNNVSSFPNISKRERRRLKKLERENLAQIGREPARISPTVEQTLLPAELEDLRGDGPEDDTNDLDSVAALEAMPEFDNLSQKWYDTDGNEVSHHEVCEMYEHRFGKHGY